MMPVRILRIAPMYRSTSTWSPPFGTETRSWKLRKLPFLLTAIMGRESAYTGKKVTWDEMMGSDMELGPQGELSLGPVDMKAVIPIAGSAPE